MPMRLAAALLALAVLVPAAPAAAAPLRLGLHASHFVSAEEAQRMALGGADLVRITFDWGRIETTPGLYDFSAYDELVERTATAGVEVLPVVLGAPSFRRHTEASWPPGKPGRAAYANLMRALVRRYGPLGSFWSEHPAVPPRPIRSWQVWNEPNLGPFSPKGKGRAADYAKLLIPASRAIHGADPNAKVILAGMPEHLHGRGSTYYEFVDDLFAIEGAVDAVDAVAVHPYAPTVRHLLQTTLPEMTDEAHEAAGAGMRIWVTELGWATEGRGDTRFVSTTAGQAKLLDRVLQQLPARAKKLKIDAAVVFSFRDVADHGVGPQWQLHTGLFRLDGAPKPAWGVFAAHAGGTPGEGKLPPALGLAAP
jgi:hypothetical protein